MLIRGIGLNKVEDFVGRGWNGSFVTFFLGLWCLKLVKNWFTRSFWFLFQRINFKEFGLNFFMKVERCSSG